VSSFIEKYGTHIIVGLGLGGQDVVYVKQEMGGTQRRKKAIYMQM
jgi:hypothetical protein